MDELLAGHCLTQLRAVEAMLLRHGELRLAAQLSLVIERLADRYRRPLGGLGFADE